MIMRYKELTHRILLFTICIIASNALNAQAIDTRAPQDTTKPKDLYKEFEYNSFENATRKIKDSTIISQHLIGFKVGYGMANVNFSQDIEHKGFNTPKNFGIYYTYCHSLWKNMPYFGIHTGLEYSELGYTSITKNKNEAGEVVSTTENKQVYQAIEFPLLSQFRADFWKMRVFINLGPYGYYITSSDIEGGIPETTNRAGIGIMGGGGLALIFKPIELHLECNYRYAMSHFCNPEIYSTEYWLYTHASQLTFSLGVFFRLGSGKKK